MENVLCIFIQVSKQIYVVDVLVINILNMTEQALMIKQLVSAIQTGRGKVKNRVQKYSLTQDPQISNHCVGGR